MEYSKAPKQPQSSARLICHFHSMTRTGCTGAHRSRTVPATGDDIC